MTKKNKIFKKNNGASFVFRKAISIICLSMCVSIPTVQADMIDQARRIHHRLTGINPTPAVLTQMVGFLQNGQDLEAARLAISNPAFCNISLKSMVTPWTTEDHKALSPLNDYIATVIGIIRDERPFTEVLTGDVVYVGDVNAYSHTDNDHYEALDQSGADLCDPEVLVPVAQSSLAGTTLTPDTASGVLTTRQSGLSFLSGGTNRLLWMETLATYMCTELESSKDSSVPADRVRQDVNRAPGGVALKFIELCVGCHGAMDGFTGAFAYYDFNEDEGRLVYSPGQVKAQYLQEPDGFYQNSKRTTDDSWVNYWREGFNSNIGWSPIPGYQPGQYSSGNGMKSLMTELTMTQKFSTCQVERAFERVCNRPPQTMADHQMVDAISDEFIAENYNYKNVWLKTAVYCKGD